MKWPKKVLHDDGRLCVFSATSAPHMNAYVEMGENIVSGAQNHYTRRPKGTHVPIPAVPYLTQLSQGSDMANVRRAFEVELYVLGGDNLDG